MDFEGGKIGKDFSFSFFNSFEVRYEEGQREGERELFLIFN